MDETNIVQVVLALWRQRAMSLDGLAGVTGLEMSVLRRALAELDKRCVLEWRAQSIELVASGAGIWRDVLEHSAAQRGGRLGRAVRVFQQTASTNDVCWNALGGDQPGEMDGLVALAEEQTAGRGRRGNAWTARRGQSVLMSVLLWNTAAANDALTLLAGLAVAEGIEKVTGGECEIKWPNDVLIGGKKVAGILVEHREGSAVVGMGVNVAQHSEDFPPEIRGRATSLYAATGRRLDRLEVMEAVLERLEMRLSAGGEEWLGAWKRRCTMLGKTVEMMSNGKPVCGCVLDVHPMQGLAVRDEFGGTHWCGAMTSTVVNQ